MKEKAWLLGGITLALALLAGCKSAQEAAGDKFRKAGDPINSLMQYEAALQRGEVSKEFWDNYALVNVQAMAFRSQEDPSAEFLDILKDTVSSLLAQHPNPATEAEFAKALYNIGIARINMGGIVAERGVNFLRTAAALPNKPPELGAQIDEAMKTITNRALSDIQDVFGSSEETAGIVADYKMNQLALQLGKTTPEMNALWSKIRQKNLSTYLMYDLEGLLPEVDARINKYALLLGIVKYNQSGNKVNAQIKIFNGGSGPIRYTGKGFLLYDKEGNSYPPTSLLGAAKKNDIVGSRDESKTGGVSFTLNNGAEPDFIEYTFENYSTRKYLP